MKVKNIEAIYPLSPVQEALLQDGLRSPQSVASLEQWRCELRGTLDVPAFERAWQQAAQRNPLLRVFFVWENLDKPLQLVRPQATLSLEQHDWQDVSAERQREMLEQLLQQSGKRGIDLAKAPLLRLTLCRTALNTYQFICSYHPLLLDLWSLRLLLNEVFVSYEGFQQGQNLQTKSLNPYWNYLTWLKQQDASAAESFWRQSLEDFDAPTSIAVERRLRSLPADAPAYGEQRIHMSHATTAALVSLAREHQLDLDTLVQGAWALLLNRYSGESEVSFGVTLSGRPSDLPAAESIIGPFSNTLPLRVKVTAEETAIGWLKQLNTHQARMRRYGYISTAQIRGWMNLPHSLSLFESIVILNDNPTHDLLSNQYSGLHLREAASPGHAASTLTLRMLPEPELTLQLNYACHLFDDTTIRRMLEHLEVLLTSIASHPGQPLSHLTLLTHAERHQLLFEFNDTSAHSPAHHLCFHQLFEQQVDSAPHNLALSFADEQLTYRELNERANQLAHYLCSLGVGPDTLVAIMLERSLETVISILAIHKAGAAYLPLDPAYPADRLSFMLSDAQPAAIISRELLLDELPMLWMQIVDLDTDQPLIDSQPTENLELEVSLEQMAYLIYTSGSTGQPKGVMVAHRGLSNLASAQVKAFAVDSSSRVLQFASLSFDASIFEIVMALRAGATLHLTPPQSLLGSELLSLLQEQAITNITIPPSVLSTLPTAELPELQTIVVAGEACSPELVERWSAGRRFFNAYGPTEATVWSSVKECEADGARPSIGCPIENTRLYVMDERLRVAPVGVGGELYIAGAGVARGYLNRADLTAEKFVPNPYSAEAGERLYRTGDVARWLTSGELEYLGRIDHQVKVRGYRIELGEIESALARHPMVCENIVIAREEAGGEKRLVAYLVTIPEQMPSITELRDYLKESLPEYMIPANFVQLDTLPLTPNGKVDRKALPAPEMERPTLGEAYVAPRTQTEQVLSEVWSEVLGVERIGIEDNFFALGGDSIRSVQVLAKAQQRGFSLSLQQLFEHQCIRSLAEQLVSTEADALTSTPTLPFSLISSEDREKLPEEVEDAYPLTMTQAGMLFHSELNPSSAVYHSINSFRLRAPFDVQALRAAAQRLAHRHPLLRTSFDLSSYSEPLQLVHQAVEVPVEVSDWRHLSASEQEQALQEWLEEEKVRHFEWSSAPLWRFIAQRLDEESFQFTFTAHHGIIDGWSDGLFLTELFKRYLSAIKGEEQRAEEAERELESGYREYVALERAALKSEESESYWRELVGESNIIRVPRLAASKQSAADVSQTRKVDVTISPEVFAGLKRLAREAGAPLKSVLLAAHLRVMSLLGGGSDVLTGLVTNGRPETPDGERIIGLFLNTLPFRLRLSGGSWQELVEETFAAERRMLLHRRYPLAQIQKLGGGGELFETAFNFTHFHVYESLEAFSDVEVLDSVSVAETNFALLAHFNMDLSGSRIDLGLGCDTAALSKEQITAIGGYYAKTLKAMAQHPQQRYQTHSLLSSSEQHQLLLEWNETHMDVPALCLHQLFEAQVERTPETIALVYEAEQLSYRELNERANQLAHYLRSLGVGPDMLVGILMERSLEMVVSLLAVLKAGGAYLPLDPAYPQERLAFMLSDAEVQVLLSQQRLLQKLPPSAARVVSVDGEWETIAKESCENPATVLSGENLAYVIYTSGSTGNPKGALISHHAIVNHMSWMQRCFPLHSADRVLQKTPFSFDASVWEFYAPLLAGAQLVIARPGAHQDSERLIHIIRQEQVSVLQLVPTLLQMLLEEPEFGQCESLRRLFCGGEALSVELAQRCRASLPQTELINLYGPTEATIDASYWCAPEGDEFITVPIGRPVSNTQVYILDEQLEPVPVGVEGELYIGGEGLARGYLKRAELTAEKFIPHPFSNEEGARLYRTGDVARWLEHGEIEYLGRADHQVKFRGHRIELGEIEAALTEHDGVREAVVVALEERAEKRIVAYVVAAPEQTVTPVDLRGYLSGRVPEYMAPSVFVLLDKMPLTPSGKIDRRALPAPDQTRVEIEATYLAPRTPVEEMLCGIFSNVLGLSQVGIHDNFFELGGHSLLVTQAVSQIRKVFQTELPLRTLFEAPTVVALAEAVELERQRGAGVEVRQLERVSRERSLPLSFAQQRLWFLYQFNPESSFYNIPAAVRLSGPLNVTALEQALSEIVRRHETLRTSFPSVDGQPVQHIAPAHDAQLPLIDLSDLPAMRGEEELLQLISEDARRAFDLENAPPLRLSLVRLSEEEHVLLLTVHHIISDGWSRSVLMSEVATLYRSFVNGQSLVLPELSIQYADYAVWQREWLQGEVLEKQLGYWKQQLSGAPPLLELPTDYPRPAEQSFRGATYHFTLSAELTEKLKALSRREGVTLFMTLLAAFQTLLYRYSGQEDLSIGTPIAGRNRTETEALIGFFINTLALRTDLSGNPRFSQLLKRVREVALSAYAHQDVPFEKLVEELQPQRNTSRTPLFQVMFLLQQSVNAEGAEMPGVRAQMMELASETAKFDLTLAMEEHTDGLRAGLEYNTDLYQAESVERLARHLEVMLEAVVADPSQHLSELPVLTSEERRQLLAKSNIERREDSQPRCLHQLFEAQVERTPDAVALVFEDQQLTYRELNERANQLAHYLRSLGVGPDALVGILMERSPEMVIGLLAILKAGGAYLPLDPAYPQERLRFMLEDAQVSILLTEQRLAGSVALPELEVISVEAVAAELAEQSRSNVESGVRPENLSYVIYTSGSTGKPKGVLVTHANVARLFATTQGWFHFDDSDVWTFFHSYAFDFSVWELWGALLYGGRLVIVPYLVSRSPEAFYETLRREKVTVLNQTPSAFRQLMQADVAKDATQKLALRYVIFGGEALELQSLEPWFKRHGDERPQLVNMYGITETTVHVTYRPLRIADLQAASGSVIGEAIPDLQVYVLDQHGQPLPLRVTGEMYVGGAGVARGYLNRPELTAERFIPDPFSAVPGARLYKTGDLARYLPSGELEYLGRADHQVKVRGFRIELGEIESALSRHPMIQENIVIAREEANGEKRLVAYLVTGNEQMPSITELRDYLKGSLPEYMIPANFVQLEAIPLTTNGKVDRKALPAPEAVRPELEEVYVAPRTQAEQALCEVWSEVLGVRRVGIEDNFFALGGDSIRSVQVLAKAQQRGLRFTLPQLFQHQTVRSLADEIGNETHDLPQTIRPAALSLISKEDRAQLPEDAEDAYPVTMLQMGMLYHSAYAPEEAVYHNVNSFRLRAPFCLKAFQESLHQIAKRHPVLRTSFALTGYSEPLQLVHSRTEIPLQVEDLRHLSDEEQEKTLAAWFEEEKNRRFDWQSAPLMRFHVHRLSEETFQFSFTEHHAILDGWSVASMLTELFQRYLALTYKEALPLTPPPTSAFRDFVAMEREALEADDQWLFWAQKLDDSTMTRLPRRSSSQPDAALRRGRVKVQISEEVYQGLERLAQMAASPLKSALLAAHLRVLSFVSANTDVMTGLVTNGRPEEADGERVLGLFLNTLPLRLQLSGGSWVDLVRETFAAEREILPFRRYPMAELQRMQGGQPLFETLFNYVHFHVYQNLPRVQNVQLSDEKIFAETNFTFEANFSHDISSAKVNLTLSYDASELTEQQIEAIGEYYANTLEAMAHNPQQSYETYSLLSADEQRQLLLEWNETQMDAPAKCLHELIEAQAERTPETVALSFEAAQLTYRELNERANQLARYLQSLGVGPESLVGILMERSVEMVVSLLGVLKAGGAYLPLDPAYPQERLRFMLEDAEVNILLTERRLAESIATPRLEVISVETIAAELGEQSRSNVESGVGPDNLSYVIYTSGSTGRPKGAMNTHQGVVNCLQWMQQTYHLADSDCFLFKTSLNFDPSVWEVFWPLMVGARIVVARPEEQYDSAALVATIKRQQVTAAYFVPSLLALFMEEETVSQASSLRYVICGGESLSVEMVERFYSRLSGAELHHSYGPTETAIAASETVCVRAGVEAQDGKQQSDAVAGGKSQRRVIPIGRPIGNTSVYVLDEQLQPVPIEVVGELYIGGVGLGRGYLNRAELTATRFIPDPFSAEAGARLYKTGDLVRYLPNGELEFVGRRDHQVKVRGVRIELGEIEAALLQHEAVREALVLVREDARDEKRLVAYVVTEAEQSMTGGELRDFVNERLPEYMIPAAFVLLPEMPLTPSGKIDRRALPAPERDTTQPDRLYIAPRDYQELQLTRVWEEVLGVRPIGVRDNFFELGGYSLSAVRLMARISRLMGQEIPLSALFKGATVEQLASLLKEQSVVEAGRTLVEIQRGGTRQPFFCVHPVGGNVFAYVALAQQLGKDQPFYAHQSQGLHEGEMPLTEIEQMATRYLEELRGVQPCGPYMLGGWSMGGVVAFEMAQRLERQGEEVALLALFDTKAPSAYRALSEASEAQYMLGFAQDLGLSVEHLPLDSLRQLTTDEQLTYIAEQAKLAGTLAPDSALEQARRLFRVYTANSRALAGYVPSRYQGRITLFRAEESEMRDSAGQLKQWTELAEGGIELHEVSGTHYSMFREPHVRVLAEMLKTSIEEAQAIGSAVESFVQD